MQLHVGVHVQMNILFTYTTYNSDVYSILRNLHTGRTLARPGLQLQGALLVGSCAGKIGVQLIQGLLKVQLAGFILNNYRMVRTVSN